MIVYAVILVIGFGPYNQQTHTQLLVDNLASRSSCEAVAAEANRMYVPMQKAVCVERVIR